ncbi:30409_t:CDS:2, partial [Gigaspora margarita]
LLAEYVKVVLYEGSKEFIVVELAMISELQSSEVQVNKDIEQRYYIPK